MTADLESLTGSYPAGQQTILVLGSSGLLGSALKKLAAESWEGIPVFWANRASADLRNRTEVARLFHETKPSIVINCAAVVGGIGKNTSQPLKMIIENLQMDANVIEASNQHKVNAYLNFSSNCVYPTSAPRPLHPSTLFSGEVEATNFGFAHAKLAALAACGIQNVVGEGSYKTLILSNLYGTSDDFSPQNSHLVGAVATKVLNALREGSEDVSVWGSGRPMRELTFAEDVADFVVKNVGRIPKFPPVMNLGSGIEYSVAELHQIAMKLVELDLELSFDLSRPDGVTSKLLDSSVARRDFGWLPKTSIFEGLSLVIQHIRTKESRE